MHELGIVFKVIEIAEETAAANGIGEIESVTLRIGEVSGVIEEYLQKCWTWSIRKYPQYLEHASLIVEPIPAVTWCDECRTRYETVRYGRTCPHCGSSRTWLLQGNEFLVKEIAAYEQ